MNEFASSMARQVAQAASAFEERRTGHAPKSVTVVLGGDTLVITLHGTFTMAQKLLAANPRWRRPGAGISPPVVCQLFGAATGGDQENHCGGRARNRGI
jgi:Na+-translocating membrane potential-generating system (MpsC)